MHPVVLALAVERLPNRTYHIRQVFLGGKTYFNIAIAPATEIGYIETNPLGIVDLMKRHIDRQPQAPCLGDNINEIRFGLVGDMQFQELFADTGIERHDSFTE